jgi:hypothetical protein
MLCCDNAGKKGYLFIQLLLIRFGLEQVNTLSLNVKFETLPTQPIIHLSNYLDIKVKEQLEAYFGDIDWCILVGNIFKIHIQMHKPQ